MAQAEGFKLLNMFDFFYSIFLRAGSGKVGFLFIKIFGFFLLLNWMVNFFNSLFINGYKL